MHQLVNKTLSNVYIGMDPRNASEFERAASEELIRLRAENARLEAELAGRQAQDAVCDWIQFFNRIDSRYLSALPGAVSAKERLLLDHVRMTRNLRVHPPLTWLDVMRLTPHLPAGAHREAVVKMMMILRYFVNRQGSRVTPPAYSRRAFQAFLKRQAEDKGWPVCAALTPDGALAFREVPTTPPAHGSMHLLNHPTCNSQPASSPHSSGPPRLPAPPNP
jgi:hypothetical protein